ncbi:phosphotransferase enzyme family protein [Histoplasma capsulatum H143]|uniref:Phosphotransferase enzyme family protein n=1 Tax=Ajellomyces capsulatus (strain H143) TaxID=544712 RepID=C6HKZ7_AJECH|nr:phosphotransferase enzyme family protein [Histoplasma capsulatum H143]
MDSSVRLPYYATDVPLPLPTEAEIENAPNISPEYGGQQVVQVGSHYVMKFEKGVNLIEGENMLFVQEMTKIPHIADETLAKLWTSLTYAEKESIVAKLCDYYKKLHQLPSPGYYDKATINGSFVTEAVLNEAMAQKYTYDDQPHHKADFYCQCLPCIFHDHKPTFTHGDCQCKNIMIQSNPQQTTASNQILELVILDWEKSGWYSSCWEYCLAVCALHWDDDWGLWIEKMLDPFIPENCGPRAAMFSNGPQRLTPREYNGASELRLPYPQHGHPGWLYARTFARMKEQSALMFETFCINPAEGKWRFSRECVIKAPRIMSGFGGGMRGCAIEDLMLVLECYWLCSPYQAAHSRKFASLYRWFFL